jgi:hypothetical protein
MKKLAALLLLVAVAACVNPVALPDDGHTTSGGNYTTSSGNYTTSSGNYTTSSGNYTTSSGN